MTKQSDGVERKRKVTRMTAVPEETLPLKVYTSFPIARSEDGGMMAQERLDRLVRDYGGIPVSPLHIPPWRHHGECPDSYAKNPNGHSAACHLRGDLIVMLLNCDAVIMGIDSHTSVGCRLEQEVATLCGLPVFFEGLDGDVVDLRGHPHPADVSLFEKKATA